MSIRVLVSGGAGYIGTVLCHYLYDKKIDFAVIDNLSNSSLKFFRKNFIFYKGNINAYITCNSSHSKGIIRE